MKPLTFNRYHDIHMRNSFTSFPKGEFSINSPLLYAYFGLVVLAAVMSYPIYPTFSFVNKCVILWKESLNSDSQQLHQYQQNI
jgi:uncharacterized membrane protein